MGYAAYWHIITSCPYLGSTKFLEILFSSFREVALTNCFSTCTAINKLKAKVLNINCKGAKFLENNRMGFFYPNMHILTSCPYKYKVSWYSVQWFKRDCIDQKKHQHDWLTDRLINSRKLLFLQCLLPSYLH